MRVDWNRHLLVITLLLLNHKNSNLITFHCLENTRIFHHQHHLHNNQNLEPSHSCINSLTSKKKNKIAPAPTATRSLSGFSPSSRKIFRRMTFSPVFEPCCRRESRRKKEICKRCKK